MGAKRWRGRLSICARAFVASRPLGGYRASTPAGVRAPLGRSSGGVASLNHRLPAGMPPASSGAASGIMLGRPRHHPGMPPAIPGMPPHHPGMPPASCSDASGIIRGRLRDREGMPRASRSTAGGIAAGRVYRPPRANVMEKSPQCHGKVREVARRLGRPFRARGPYWPECQGVALGWRRPHRWRSESAPCGAHQDSTVPPRRHRKKSPKGHSSLWNSLTTNTRNGAKGTSGGCVSPSTELRPGSL